MSESVDVVVIGGGYAGVMAANRLAGHSDVAVTLINPRPEFVQRIRLHQRLAGTHDALDEYGRLLNGRVRLLVDTVSRIEAGERRVDLASGGTAGYDYLVYAVGSVGDDRRVPGVAEFAYPIAGLEQADRLRPVLESAPASAAVTVVGAGPAGIEAASEIAARGRAVTLVCGGVLGPSMHPRARRFVTKQLAAIGVKVLDGPGTTVTEVKGDAVVLADGREVPAGITVWAAGFGVPDLAALSGLSTDAVGRLLTDETLTSIDDERVVAAGDCAAPSGRPFRMGCQSAVQLGPQAAETILARLAGKEPAQVDVGFAGLCLSLGRQVGVFQFSHKDDTARSRFIGGRLGAFVKEFICRGTVWQLKTEGRKPGRHKWWASDPTRREALHTERGEAMTAR